MKLATNIILTRYYPYNLENYWDNDLLFAVFCRSSIYLQIWFDINFNIICSELDSFCGANNWQYVHLSPLGLNYKSTRWQVENIKNLL